MTNKEKLRYCVGCHDDFYNGEGFSGCWSLENMELIMKKEVPIDQVPPWTQKAQLFPKCYHKQRYVYVKENQEY
jgi:hypothetical protein